MKVALCIPVGKRIEVWSFISFLNFLSQMYREGHLVRVMMMHNFMTDVARQSLVSKAVQLDVDYILQVDDDMTFEIKDFYKLVEDMEDNNLEFLAAKAYVRNSVTGKRKLAMCEYNKERDAYEKMDEFDDEGIVEVDATGHGFIVMKKGFVEDMLKEHGMIYRLGQNLGEDCYFSRLCKDDGIKVCYDADVTVGHISTIVNK